MRTRDPKYDLTPEVEAELHNAALRLITGEKEPRGLTHWEEILKDVRSTPHTGSRPPETPIQGFRSPVPPRLLQELAWLTEDYYKAIDRGNPAKLKAVLEKGFPVNFRNPLTGETALHRLAGSGARPAIRIAMAEEDCNYLIRDKLGRLPSELAYTAGNDPALARLLGNKERKQATMQGVKLTKRAKPD